jgi:hypothetical protein
LATGNVLAPALPDTYFLPVEEARKRVRDAVIHLICHEPRNTTFYTLGNNYVAIKGDVHHLPAAFADLGTDLIPTLVGNVGLTFAHMMTILQGLVEQATPRIKAMGTTMYINLFVALGKKGSITDRKADDLNDAIRSELGNPDSVDEGLDHVICDTYTSICS